MNKLLGVLLLLSVAVLSGCGCIKKEIARVGGCTQHTCAVKYTDGTFGSVRGFNAIEGNLVCPVTD